MGDVTELAIPTWTLGDRLRKARIAAGVSTQAMADELVRNRNTITNYETGFTHPSGRVIERWAAICSVPVQWLLVGDIPRQGDGSVSGESWSACTTRLAEVQEELPFGETIEVPAVAEPDRTVVPFRRAS